MGWAKASLLAACLMIAGPASFEAAVAAGQTTDARAADSKALDSKAVDSKAVDSKAADAKTTDAKPAAPSPAAKTSDDAGKPALSKSEIRKLDAKCSDEADAKHLHGEARKTFRSA